MTTLRSIEGSELAIPFKVAFKHASAERHAMQSLWVQVRSASGMQGFGEGCPREYVTAENMDAALTFVDRHRDEWIAGIRDVHSLRDWVNVHQDEINTHPAAWTAVELAILDLFGKLAGSSVERLLGQPELDGRFRYTAVIGDGPPQQFAAQLQKFIKAGFSVFKIKLGRDMAANQVKVRALAEAGIPAEAVRADANNLWRDAKTCIADLESLQFGFAALEEPLHSGDFTSMAELASALGTRIILDESISRLAQLDQIPPAPGQWIINCRVSKMGGLVRALPLLDSVRSRGLGIIVGAHVGETSVLTRAALTLARAAGPGLLAQEGAYGTHLLTRDVCEPSLMFSEGGVIDLAEASFANRPGLGLDVASGAVK